MLNVLETEKCGFVGCPATGLSYLEDVRPHQQHIELWEGPVVPEPFERDTIPWDRHKVNNAANPLHLEQRFVSQGQVVRYKIAWVGGANVLFDRAKLLDVGGFSWWSRLPPEHAGEEVVVQFLLISQIRRLWHPTQRHLSSWLTHHYRRTAGTMQPNCLKNWSTNFMFTQHSLPTRRGRFIGHASNIYRRRLIS